MCVHRHPTRNQSYVVRVCVCAITIYVYVLKLYTIENLCKHLESVDVVFLLFFHIVCFVLPPHLLYAFLCAFSVCQCVCVIMCNVTVNVTVTVTTTVTVTITVTVTVTVTVCQAM